jgi:hypothetical protein
MCKPPCGQAQRPFRPEPQIKKNKPELLAHLHFLVVPQSILFHAKIKNKQTTRQKTTQPFGNEKKPDEHKNFLGFLSSVFGGF